MESKVIDIIAPEGYEIDEEKSTFENIVLKLKEVKTWKDLHNHSSEGMFFINNLSNICQINSYSRIKANFDKNLIPNREYAKALLALHQLILLRSYYVKDWKQKFKKDFRAYAVFVRYDYNSKEDTVDWEFTGSAYRTLSFPTSEMAQDFIKNNRKLILKAKLVL